jgi:hypothetical protein
MTPAARARWLRKLARETDRARLARARGAVQQARAAKRSARARALAACRRARTHFRRWLTGQRAALRKRIESLRARLKAETATRRARIQACCGKTERQRARAAGDAAIARARAELAELLKERRRERVWSRPNPLKGAALGRTRAQESDHSVAVNLTPDELIVWGKVKAKIHGTDRMSRTEAFQHWMHDHRGEVARILAQDADEAYQRAVRNEAKERQRMRSARSDRQLASYVARELAAGDVPF